MTAAILALVWFGAVSLALAACAVFERRARVFVHPDRTELAPPREIWSRARRKPPAASVIVRGLANFARLVRSETIVSDQRPGLRMLGRVGISVTLATTLAMIPFAGTWGGTASGAALVPLDLPHGLAALGLLFVLTALSRVTLALSERNSWSRMGGARQASRAMAALALLTLVLVPIAVDAGSLRLHDIVLDQQRPLAIVDGLWARLGGDLFERLRDFPWPAWNVFTQPLTAFLFIPTASLLLRSPRADDPVTGSVGISGLGLDADPVDLYWTKLDTRLSSVVSAALFVTLFLGAGSIPLVEPSALVSSLSPFVGEFLPTLLVVALHIGTFLAKWILVLGVGARLSRIAAASRDDRALRFATRRLLPLAWANLLLVAALRLWFESGAGGAS